MAGRVLIVTTGAAAEGGPPGGAREGVEWVSPLVVTHRFAEVKAAIPRLAGFRTIALTSGHAVDALVSALRAAGHDVRLLAGIRIAAVGAGTAARLERYGLAADLVAEEGGGGLAREMIAAGLPGPVLHPRALDGRPELADALTAAGLRTETLFAYETTPDTAALAAARKRHASAPFAAIGFCSPRGADALIEAFGGARRLDGVTLGAIGATTQAALAAHGLAARVPDHPSVAALLDLLSRNTG